MPDSPFIIRIDDRLIHGQVLVGWCNHYPIKRFIICDDKIAKNEWEKNLLLTCVPQNFQLQVLSTDETCKFINANMTSKDLTMILVNSPYRIKEMVEIELPVKKINVGGIHYKENRKQYLFYLFLSPEEIEVFKELIDKGYVFECQDLPTNKKHDLEKILRERT